MSDLPTSHDLVSDHDHKTIRRHPRPSAIGLDARPGARPRRASSSTRPLDPLPNPRPRTGHHGARKIGSSRPAARPECKPLMLQKTQIFEEIIFGKLNLGCGPGRQSNHPLTIAVAYAWRGFCPLALLVMREGAPDTGTKDTPQRAAGAIAGMKSTYPKAS